MGARAKGQVSTELMIIIGFIIIIFIPMVVILYYKSAEISLDMDGLQNKLVASKLAYAANSLGYMGPGSALKIEFFLPLSVNTINFRSAGSGGEVTIYRKDGTQISQVTGFQLNATPSNYSGGNNYKLEFYSKNGQIFISPSN